MKSKFISPILAIAVVLAMVAVPVAVPGSGQVALASGNVTVSIEPSTTHVLPGGSFTIDTVVNNPDGYPVCMPAVRLDFDPTYFTVDSVSLVDLDTWFAPPTINNITGHVDGDPMMTTGTNTTATHIVSIRISCTAKSLEGVTTVAWVYNSTQHRKTTVAGPAGAEYLGGNMSLMFNGTVMVGAPNLTVNVSPADSGDVKVAGVTPSSYPYNSNWGWDENVTLEAVNSAAGYGFVNWTGDVANPNSSSTTVTMDALTKNVTANFAELPPVISTDPANLTFNGNVGGDVTNLTLDICNDGGYTLNWTANITGANATLFSMSPMSGSNLAATQCNSTQVAVNTTGLAAGIYHANITISEAVLAAAQGGAESAVGKFLVDSVTVSVTLNLGVPAISASPTPLTFTTNEGENPADKTLVVCNSGSGTLDWSLTDNAAWLSEAPTSGSLGADECEDVAVSVAASGMAAGDYSATITITDPAASNSPQSVPVNLYIVSAMPELPVAPAQLSASGLSISPQQVKPDQEVTISINVANTGGETGSYNAVLYINGAVEKSQSVSVAPGMTKNVIFTVTKSDAGVYDVSIAGQSGQFQVVSTSWFGGGLGTGGIVAIVVIVIVLILALFFVLRGTRREV